MANADFEPHEGYERDPAGWPNLCTSRQSAVLSEDELIAAYLAEAPFTVTAGVSPESLDAKWLSVLTWSPDRPPSEPARPPVLCTPEDG